MKGKSMSVTASDRPDFSAMTAGKAMFGMLGGIAMIKAGNKIVRENDVEDPAVFIGKALAEKIAESRSMSVKLPIIQGKNDNVASLAASSRSSDYVLDVRTINWSFVYFPTDWNNYRVIYTAKARLIDSNVRKVIAEAFCSRIPDQTDDSPSYDELLSNHAARLKQELRIAANTCVKEMSGKLL